MAKPSSYMCVCVCVCVHTHLSIDSSVSGHLGSFHVLAMVNSATKNIKIHISYDFFSSGYIPRNGIAGSYGNTIFLSNLHAVLCSDSTNLYSHQKLRRASSSLHSFQYLLFVDFLMMAILTITERM